MSTILESDVRADNLVSFIKAHGVEVVRYDEVTATVNTLYGDDDGGIYYQQETVWLNRQAVRDYLSY